MSRRALVIGGTGFIGTHLTVTLMLDKEIEVATFSIDPRGAPRHFQGDVLDRGDLDVAFDAFRPDEVYFLVRPTEAARRNDPMVEVELSAVGALRVIEAATKYGMPAIVWASSAFVYDNSPYPRSDEDPHRVAPTTLYGVGKVMMEVAAASYPRSRVARFFNVYGPGQVGDLIVPRIMGQIPPTGPINLKIGNTGAARDFVYVDDVVTAIIALARRREERIAPVNIGTGVGYSIRSLVDLISELIDRRITIQTEPSKERPGDYTYLVADTRRMRSLLHDCSFRSLRSGLIPTLRAYGVADGVPLA